MAKVEVGRVESQLTGDSVTCPVEVRFDKDSVVADFCLTHPGEFAKLVSFEFSLAGGGLYLIVRDMGADPVRLSKIKLHDFSKEDAQTVSLSGGMEVSNG